MSLSAADITRLARLARIGIEAGEVDAVANKLNNVFGLIEKMRAVDTTGVAPMSHPQPLGLRLRDDVVSVENQREAFLDCAPQTEAGLYLVPRVIE